MAQFLLNCSQFLQNKVIRINVLDVRVSKQILKNFAINLEAISTHSISISWLTPIMVSFTILGINRMRNLILKRASVNLLNLFMSPVIRKRLRSNIWRVPLKLLLRSNLFMMLTKKDQVLFQDLHIWI